MKISQVVIWGMLPLFLMACSNNDSSEWDDDSFLGKEMQVVPSIGNMQSRLGMESVSDIQAFMLQVSGTELGKYDYHAVIKPEGDGWKSYNVNSDGTVGDALQMLWGNGQNPVTVAALYKGNRILTSTDFRAAKFEVVADQGTTDAFKKGDYLYMLPTQVSPTANNGKVGVTFSHLMSKICLKLTMDYQFNEIPGTALNPVTDLTIGGTVPSGIFDIYQQKWDYTSSPATEVKLCETSFVAGSGKTKKAMATYECLLLPQQVDKNGFSVNITIDGKKYTWTSNAAINLESNYKYELPITVGKDYVLAGNIFVSDWDTGEMLPNGETDVVTKVDVWDGTIATDFAGGSGTKEDPYQIATGAQLAYLAKGVNSGSTAAAFLGTKYFALTQDIDLNNMEWTSIGYANYTWNDDAQSWLAYGEAFHGLFDGQNHVISNLKMDRREAADNGSVGLFGWIIPNTSEYSVKDLTIRNASVFGKHHVGILVGNIKASSSSHSEVSNVRVNGKVIATENYGWCGGLFGEVAWLTVSNCTADVQVEGRGFTGGLVAAAFASTFNGCSVKGSVSGSRTVGGFSGTLYDGTKATNCISYVNVTSDDWRCGGFSGALEGFGEDSRVILENCSAKGDVYSMQDWGKVGGFVGWCAYLTATNCSCTGTLTLNEVGNVGAFMGEDDGYCQILSCKYDAGQNPSLKIVGKDNASSIYDITAMN